MIDASQVSVANLVTTAPLPCLLCSRRPAPWGCLFTPRDPQHFGAPAGKLRLIRYSLCGRCYRLPHRVKRAEARIKADLAVMAAQDARHGVGVPAGLYRPADAAAQR